MILVSPIPRGSYARVWDWLQQYPENNFDDYGPKSYQQFSEHMDTRVRLGEYTWVVEHEGRLAGAIGYAPITKRAGIFHGICFDRAVHGQGVAKAAVRAVLAELWERGQEKASATFFADNARIYRFLKSLGAEDEGYLRRQTMRAGKPVDMRLVAFFKEIE